MTTRRKTPITSAGITSISFGTNSIALWTRGNADTLTAAQLRPIRVELDRSDIKWLLKSLTEWTADGARR